MMDPSEVVILCGEWETGPAPQADSGEKYNVVLKISEIIRHPSFDTSSSGLGVEGGNDIAIFKVTGRSIKEANTSANEINPICLPGPTRPTPNPEEGFHSGWANPPPLNYFRKFGPGYLSFVTDTFKQWHYKLDIEGSCRNPTYAAPDVSYYPPGLICAKEVNRQFCPNAGDSGSPLMVKDGIGRYTIGGILSFFKGCDKFSISKRDEAGTKFELFSKTRNPLAYTKLSCYLPWVAEQFGLSYENQASEDRACVEGSGQKPYFNSTTMMNQYETECRTIPGPDELNPNEDRCIFPFYYRGKKYTGCGLFGDSNFVVPVWQCPTNNITTKYPGTDISHFEADLLLNRTYCLNEEREVDPDPNKYCSYDSEVFLFSTCKTDCSGGKHYLFEVKKLSLSSLQLEAMASLEVEQSSWEHKQLLGHQCFPC